MVDSQGVETSSLPAGEYDGSDLNTLFTHKRKVKNLLSPVKRIL
jgi:hypothetical protein